MPRVCWHWFCQSKATGPAGSQDLSATLHPMFGQGAGDRLLASQCFLSGRAFCQNISALDLQILKRHAQFSCLTSATLYAALEFSRCTKRRAANRNNCNELFQLFFGPSPLRDLMRLSNSI